MTQLSNLPDVRWLITGGLAVLAAVVLSYWFAKGRAGRGLRVTLAGLRWLVAHRPAERARPVVCHGDLHPGNILVDDDGAVTAVLDYPDSKWSVFYEKVLIPSSRRSP